MRLGIDPKNDYAFKRVFGREQNTAILIHLLNAVLQLPAKARVATVDLLNPFNDKDALDDKLSILDIKARDQQGRQFNIEMQLLPEPHLNKRVTYYLTRFHQSQLHEGEEYQELQPTCAICFVNGVIWRKVADYHLTFRLLETRHGFAFTDDLAVHILELPKFTNAAEELTNPLEAWLYFLRHAANLDSEQLPATLQAPEIQRAMGELTMLTQSELERERYEAREKHQRDERSRLRAAREAEEAALREGLEQGRAEGELDLIHFCQQLLGKPLTPREELLALAAEQRASLVTALQQELLAKQQTGNNP